LSVITAKTGKTREIPMNVKPSSSAEQSANAAYVQVMMRLRGT
jgi:hypothetical protein